MAIDGFSGEQPKTDAIGSVPESATAASFSEESRDVHERHLATDHLLTDLKSRTISSGFITAGAQCAKFIVNLMSTVVLARLLSPHEFGLVAMVTAITSLFRVFRGAGLFTATVQWGAITHAQVSNLFWINVASGGLTSLIIVALAPVIAGFYHEPRLFGITLALSIPFLLNGFTTQHQALLSRQMRFKAVALIEVGSMVAGLAAGISMALRGCGYWSLVGSTLAMEGVGLVLTWSVSRWRPQWPMRRIGTWPLVSFGAHLTAGSFMYSLAQGTDDVLIGRFYGSHWLGLYSRAGTLLTRPLDYFLAPLNTVFVPVLSRLQDQPKRYRRTFLQVYEAIALVGFPFTGLLLAVARPLTMVLLGPKWEKAAVIFAGFTVAALFAPLASASTWLFTSQGRGRDLLVANAMLSALTVAAFIAGLPFGPFGVAIAYSVSGLFVRLPLLYYQAGRSGPVSAIDLLAGFLRHLPSWAIVFAATWLTRAAVTDFSPVIQLFICAPVGLLAAGCSVCGFPNQRRTALLCLKTLRSLRKA